MTTLENLKQEIKKNRTRKIAEWIFKYQKFKTKIALEHIDVSLAHINKSTLSNYFVKGLIYLNIGTLHSAFPKDIKAELERIKQTYAVAPLTPSKEDRRSIKPKVYQKKNKVNPVNKVLNDLSKKAQQQGDFSWGVKMDDTIKIFSDKTKAEGFLRGINYLSLISGKDVEAILCQVEVKEV